MSLGRRVPESRALMMVIEPKNGRLALPALSSDQERHASLVGGSATRSPQEISRVDNETGPAWPIGRVRRLPLGEEGRILAASERLSGESGQLGKRGEPGELGMPHSSTVRVVKGRENRHPTPAGKREKAKIVSEPSLSWEEPRLLRQTGTVRPELAIPVKDFRGRPVRMVQVSKAGQRNFFERLSDVFRPRELVLVPVGASNVSRSARPAVPIENFSRFAGLGNFGDGRREKRLNNPMRPIVKELKTEDGMEKKEEAGSGGFLGLGRLVRPKRVSLIAEPKLSEQAERRSGGRTLQVLTEASEIAVGNNQPAVETTVAVGRPDSWQRGRQSSGRAGGQQRRVAAEVATKEDGSATGRRVNRLGKGRTLSRRSFVRLSALAAAGAAAAACAPRTTQPEVPASPTDTPAPTGTRRPTATLERTASPTPVERKATPTVIQKRATPTATPIPATATPSPEKLEKIQAEQVRIQQEQEMKARLDSSPQLKWQNQETVDSLSSEDEETQRSIGDQVNALRVCADKWVRERKLGVTNLVVDKAGLVYFKQTDGTALVALQLVDKEGVGDYAPGGLILALDSKRSAELNRLVTIAYEKADQLPAEQRPEPTFITFGVDGLLGTDSEGKPVIADSLAWQVDQGTLVALRKEMMVGWVNPRHIGKRAGSEQRELYPGWELTQQGKTAYLDQDPKKLTEAQRKQWRLFYETTDPLALDLKKQGATIDFKPQILNSSTIQDKNGRIVALWNGKRGVWAEARILNIGIDRQDYSLSCESAASAMIAQYFVPTPPDDYPNWEEYFAGIEKADNPDFGYCGDIDGGLSISCDKPGLGYGVHAGPIAQRFKEAGFNAEAVSGVDLEWVKKQLDQSFPLVVWVSYKDNPTVEKRQDKQGREYTVVLGEHATTVIGYWVDSYQEGGQTVKKTTYVVNDPVGKGSQYPVIGFWNWKLFNNMAVVVKGYRDNRESKSMP